jgi:Holliday junction resolvasome RuvABC endonuclease subunit
MTVRVLALDVSASSTGWAFTFGQARGKFEYGLIKTSPKFSRAERLAFFRKSLIEILQEFRPTHIAMEDVFLGANPKVLTLLSKFGGVAEECSLSVAGVQIELVGTNSVKSYFKSKNKEEVFNIITDIFDWCVDEVEFKKHNDLTDAIAILLYYYDEVLGVRKFREEKKYGYLYEI